MKSNVTNTSQNKTESWLRVARVVCILLTIVAPVTGAYLTWDHPWVWAIIILGSGISMILIVRRISWRIEKIEDLAMRTVARSDNRPPFLVLRSFHREGLAFRPGKYDKVGIAPGKSYLNDIATALMDYGQLLAIGGLDDTEGIGIAGNRLLYFQSSESDWPEMFKLASEAAGAVIVIPGISPGLLREIRELKSIGAISKVIVFMPPTPSGLVAKWVVRYSGTEGIAIKWGDARSKWKEIGVSLPAYEKVGMLFDLDSSGAPRQEFRLNGEVEAPDLTPIRELTNPPRGASIPISMLIPELERLEAPRTRPGLLVEVIRYIFLGY